MSEPNPEMPMYRLVAIREDGFRVILMGKMSREVADARLALLSPPRPGWSRAVEIDDGLSDVV